MYAVSTRRGDSFNALVDELFSDFFDRASVPARHTPTVGRARLDVLDKGSKFEIKVDLPGVRKDDINVGIEGARVSINAESKDLKETKDKDASNGEKILFSERQSTRYARSFELPAEIADDGAEARFEDGVLTLSLPKRSANTSKRIEIR